MLAVLAVGSMHDDSSRALADNQGAGVYATGQPSAQAEAQEAFFQPLSGGNDALDDFGAEDRRSAPVFGYR